MAYDSLELDSTLSVPTITDLFRATISEDAPQATFGTIEVSADRADDFGGFAKDKSLTTQWCVQIFVRDDGPSRHVQLIVLGSSALAKVWSGTRNTYSATAGRPKAVAVIDALRAAERAGR